MKIPGDRPRLARAIPMASIVLPVPGGPTNTTLPASSRKRSDANSRMSFSSTPGCAVKSNVSRLDWVGRQANRSRDANRRAWVVSTSTASSCSSTVTVEASSARAASRMPGNASAAAGSLKKSRCARSR